MSADLTALAFRHVREPNRPGLPESPPSCSPTPEQLAATESPPPSKGIEPPVADPGLLPRWVLYNAVGSAVLWSGLALATHGTDTSHLGHCGMGFYLWLAATLPLQAVPQWLALRRYGLNLVAWLAATAIGGLLGGVSGIVAGVTVVSMLMALRVPAEWSALGVLVVAGTIGLVTGLVQALPLAWLRIGATEGAEEVGERAWQWGPASAAGTAAFALTIGTVIVLPQLIRFDGLDWHHPAAIILGGATLVALGSAAYGVPTGFALVRLLRPQPTVRAETPTSVVDERSDPAPLAREAAAESTEGAEQREPQLVGAGR